MTRPIRRTAVLALVGAAAASALVGCAPTSGDGPRIVATTNILGDVVAQIAGDEAEVATLMKPNADPHSFEISAQEAAGLADADLLVSNGLGLEENVEQHLVTAANAGAERFVAGDHITALSFSSGDGAATTLISGRPRQDDRRRHGTRRRDRSPARRRRRSDRGTRGRLPRRDRRTRERDDDGFRERFRMAAGLGPTITSSATSPTGSTSTPSRAVISSGTTLASPSAADLDSLAAAIERTGVPAIFAESSHPDRLVQVLADEVGIDVAVVELLFESLTEPGWPAPTYLDMMRVNTDRIAQGLTR